MVKYADDAAAAGLISNQDEGPYRHTIQQLVSLCEEDDLELNVSKTKELIVDFRQGDHQYDPVTIKGVEVQRVPQYDYLGTTVTESLSWGANVQRLARKAFKRMYHLRKLRQFKVNNKLQLMFYGSVIESVMVFGVAVWGGALTCQDKRTIKRVKVCAERIMGTKVSGWETIYNSRLQMMTSRILKDNKHPLYGYLQYLPSGKRLRQDRIRTKRYGTSFVPKAISHYNTCN